MPRRRAISRTVRSCFVLVRMVYFIGRRSFS
jgi:hypothetical protein